MSELVTATERAGLDTASGTERPLTDEERAIVQRVLSDPFSFPIQFKTWLISFLESSDMILPRSSVQGLTDLLGTGTGSGILGLLPAGMIMPYGGAVAPLGAELCDGKLYAVEGKYNRLFKVIGYAYGGSGAQFAVPDLRKRLPFGQGAGQGVGVSDGRAEANRSIKHHHNFGQTSDSKGGHSHNVSVSGRTDTHGGHTHGAAGSDSFAATNGATIFPQTGGSSARTIITSSNFNTGSGGSHDHGVSLSGGTDSQGVHNHFVSGDTSGGADQDQPAFLTVGFIINY